MPILTDDRYTARHDAVTAMCHDDEGYDHEPDDEGWLNWCEFKEDMPPCQ